MSDNKIFIDGVPIKDRYMDNIVADLERHSALNKGDTIKVTQFANDPKRKEFYHGIPLIFVKKHVEIFNEYNSRSSCHIQLHFTIVGEY